MITTKQLAEELGIDPRTVLNALHDIWGADEQDLAVPNSLIPASTRSVSLQVVEIVQRTELPDLRVKSYAKCLEKKFRDTSATRIPVPIKQTVRTADNKPYVTYVFTEEQSNLIRAYIVPDRVEAVKALAVLSAQVRELQEVTDTLLFAYNKTAEKLKDEQRLLDYSNQVKVAYNRAMSDVHSLRSILQQAWNRTGDILGEE